MEKFELPPEINTGFMPRRLQLEIRSKMRRFNVIVCHRRFGKTVFAINDKIDRISKSHLEAPRGAYLAPTYGQAKRVVWDYLKKYTEHIPKISTHEQDLRVDMPHNDGRIMLLSAEDPTSLKGIYLDTATLDEFGDMNPTVWTEVIRPTLNDRHGGATFIGTPKGQNHFYKLFKYATESGDPEWFGAMYKASETGIIEQAELDSARKIMTEEEYAQEYECSFTSGLQGAYFAKELAKAQKESRIDVVPYDSKFPVTAYFDLGFDDLTSVWFIQSHNALHRVIDYYEICGADIPSIVRDIRSKGYNIGEWVFPHDVKKHEMQTGRSQFDMFRSLGCQPSRVIRRTPSKRDDINAARVILGQCLFDKSRCSKGLDALSNYQRKWNSKNNVYEDSPLHNWASNGADAFQCFAVGARDEGRRPGDFYASIRVGGEMQAETKYNPFDRGRG